jgi:PAS domain S-box-containing protein
VGERTITSKLVAVPLVAVLALLCAIFFEPFERFFAWAHRYERWQVDELIVVPILLAIAFGLYFWRKEKESERQIAEFTNEAARHKREIANHKRVEEALRSRETRYRAVVTNLPIALFAVDSDGVFTLAEGEGLDVLGLEADKVVGQSIFKSYRDVPQVVENTRRALAGQASKVFTELGGMTFETRYSPLWEDGKFSGVLGVAFDITERKRAWEALQESERRFSTLLSNTPAMVYRCLNEPDWPEEYVSEYALELTGYPVA